MPTRVPRSPRQARPNCVSRTFAIVVVALGLLLAGGALTPAVAEAQRPATTTRIVVFTGGAFGGDGEVTYDGALFSGSLYTNNLGPSPLAGVRVESVFLRYLALGGQLESTFWAGEGERRRNPMLDLAVTPRVRYPIVIGTRFLVEPYVVIPVGFSLAVWNSSVDLGSQFDRVNPGLCIGALAGVTLLTRSHVGAMLEFGWMHHVAYDSDDGGNRFALTLNQATLRAGIVYAF